MTRLRRQFQSGIEELAETLYDRETDALARLLALGERFGFGAERFRCGHVAATISTLISRLVGDRGRRMELLRQRCCVCLVDPRAGVLNGECPSRCVASFVQPPCDGDPSLLRVFHGIEEKVLQNAGDLVSVALDDQLARAVKLEVEAAIDRALLRRRAEIAQKGRRVECRQLTLFVTSFEPGQAEQVIQHVMERRNAAGEDFRYFDSLRLRHVGAGFAEEIRRSLHDRNAAAEVMGSGAPCFRAGAFESVQCSQRLLEVIDVPRRFSLVQTPVLCRAFGDSVRTESHPGAPGGGHHFRRQVGMLCGIAFQFIADAHLQVPPFTNELAQLVALLPALQAVLADAIILDGRCAVVGRPELLNAVAEAVENSGNVIVELRARERRRDAALTVGIAGRPPGSKDRLATLEQRSRDGAQLLDHGVGRNDDMNVLRDFPLPGRHAGNSANFDPSLSTLARRARDWRARIARLSHLPMHMHQVCTWRGMIQDLWYKSAVIYSLDLETFMDSDGDGCGDFEGLIRRLDYLEALGVDVIWLAPFQPSPNKDNGYDISDYYGVDPRHGSSGDFVEFMHLAKKRGMKIIIDLVVNHTSDRHRWFRESRRSLDSRYRDWYVWAEKRPANADEGMVFPGVQKATWTRDEKTGQYYHHRFFDFQPDLNIGNPAVREEIQKIVGFWLELGVDGFRVDAVPFVIEQPDPENPTRKPKMNFEYIEQLRSFVQWRAGEAILLGEANVLPKDSADYFRDGGGIHLMFNFWVNQHLFYALACGDVAPLIKALEATRELPPTAQWAQFLRNHDELDLGRLTERQRQAVFKRFGPDPSMQLYDRGIRRRLAPMIGNRAQLELAYSVMFSLPGTPVIRYGDEIGMGDDLSLDQRDAVRTPMQWDSSHAAGFSESRRPVHPLIDEGAYAYEHLNVERQKRDPRSLLRWTTQMIRLRKETPEIAWGTWQIVETESPHVLAMRYDWRNDSVLLVHNFAEEPQEIGLSIDGPLIDLREDEESAPDRRGRHRLPLDAYGYRWFRQGKQHVNKPSKLS